DSGSLYAVLVDGPRLCLLDAEMELVANRPAVFEPLTLAVDPHGRYVAIASKGSLTQLYTRFGRQAGRFTTPQPLAHLVFIPTQPMILGAAVYGTIAGMRLAAA